MDVAGDDGVATTPTEEVAATPPTEEEQVGWVTYIGVFLGDALIVASIIGLVIVGLYAVVERFTSPKRRA